jgi:hypothetical protein
MSFLTITLELDGRSLPDAKEIMTILAAIVAEGPAAIKDDCSIVKVDGVTRATWSWTADDPDDREDDEDEDDLDDN